MFAYVWSKRSENRAYLGFSARERSVGEETDMKTGKVKAIMGSGLALALAIGVCAGAPAAPAQAKTVTKDGWYCGSLARGTNSLGMPAVHKITFEKHKFTTRGPIGYSKKKAGSWTSKLTKRNAKRTFRLSSKVRYYTGGGEAGLERSSKKYFSWLAHRYNGLGLTFHVKNGKVVRMTISS